ncbi:MAG: ABC-2 family transporter protein [Spirochaetaceae bacterium]|nr:ABC-2 family transporter protein [Spirochaetaceae bacterium]MBQ3024523.1 ABC-2 family transporter protein [Spirochaetaceae bacterium]
MIKLSVYFAYFRITIKQNTIFRTDYLLGILNNIIQIFISITIWKFLYESRNTINGIAFSIVITNFIISLGLSNIFSINDFIIQNKINDGSLVNELLKPIDFKKILLVQTISKITFKFLSNFLPTFLITSLIFKILPPASIINFIIYIVSIMLGFLILWNISLIIQLTAFWIVNVWSISTIKNVLIKIFTGATIPLYFMPTPIIKLIQFTPFDTIYYIPFQIYLGSITFTEILFSIMKQIIWLSILHLITIFMWKKGCKKIIIQGG